MSHWRVCVFLLNSVLIELVRSQGLFRLAGQTTMKLLRIFVLVGLLSRLLRRWKRLLPDMTLNLTRDKFLSHLLCLFPLLQLLLLKLDFARGLADIDRFFSRRQISVDGSLLERLVGAAVASYTLVGMRVEDHVWGALESGCLLVTIDLELELLDQLLIRHVREDVRTSSVRISHCHMRDHLGIVVLKNRQSSLRLVFLAAHALSPGRTSIKAGLEYALARQRRAVLRRISSWALLRMLLRVIMPLLLLHLDEDL